MPSLLAFQLILVKSVAYGYNTAKNGELLIYWDFKKCDKPICFQTLIIISNH